MIRPGQVWLTIPEAAARVQRSQLTIKRWIREERMVSLLGRVNEYTLLVVEREARVARSSPRGVVAGQRANGMVTTDGG